MNRESISRSRHVNSLAPGEVLNVTVVRRSGGKGRFVVRADFDPSEVGNVLITVVPPEDVKSHVLSNIPDSRIGN